MAAERYEATPRRRGVSLAKGPIALMGLAALAFGVLGFIIASQSFTMHPVSGVVNGGRFLGVEGNGWTWALFAAGGALLLISAPGHWTAKSMAFIVAAAFGAAAIISLAQDKGGALGIFAQNGWTELVFGAAAVALLLLSMLPRVGRRRAAATPVGDGAAAPRRGRFARRRAAEQEPAARDETATRS